MANECRSHSFRNGERNGYESLLVEFILTSATLQSLYISRRMPFQADGFEAARDS